MPACTSAQKLNGGAEGQGATRDGMAEEDVNYQEMKLTPENIDLWGLTKGRPPRRGRSMEERGISLQQLIALLRFVQRRCDGYDPVSKTVSQQDGVLKGWYDPVSKRPLTYRTINIRQVCYWILDPLRRLHGCSLAEAIHAEDERRVSRPPKWFVGHWCGESLVDFVHRMRNFVKEKSLSDSDSFWVCWCCARRYEASGMQIGNDLGGRNIVSISDLNLLQCHFTGGGFVSPEAIDELGGRLSTLQALTSLELNFSNCSGLKTISELCKGFHSLKSLKRLELNLSRSSDFEAVGDLGNSLVAVPGLQDLVIDLSYCSALTGIEELGAGIRSLEGLQTLVLSLAGCRALASVGDLGRALGSLQALRVLEVNCTECTGLVAVDEVGASFKSLPRLNSLALKFTGCSALTDQAISFLFASLVGLQNLTALDLNLFGCAGVTSLSALCRSVQALQALTSLKLDLFGCTGLDNNRDAEVAPLLELKRSLKTFELNRSH